MKPELALRIARIQAAATVVAAYLRTTANIAPSSPTEQMIRSAMELLANEFTGSNE